MAKAIQEQDYNMEVYKPTPYDYAAIYARKSSSNESLSLDTQVSLAKDLAYEKKLIIYDVYQEVKSAVQFLSDSRAEFKRLLQDAEAGKFKTVIVFKRDRLGRNIKDLLKIRRFFAEHEINVIFTSKGEYVSDGSTTSNFVENMLIAIAEMEADTVKDRIEPGKENQRKRGDYATPRIPFLFKLAESGPYKYVLKDENISSKLEFIFEEYIRVGKSNEVIKDILKDLTARYKEVNDKYKKDKSESASDNKGNISYSTLIKQAMLAGLQLKDRKKRVEDTFIYNKSSKKYEVDKDMYQKITNVKASISPELWYEAICVWKNNYKSKYKHSQNYLFKDLLFCDSCQSQIIFKEDIYQCKKKCIYISKDELLKVLVTRVLKDIITKRELEAGINKRIKEFEKIKRKLDDEIRRNRAQQSLEVKTILYKNLSIDDCIELKNLALEHEQLVKERGDIIRKIEGLTAAKEHTDKILEDKSQAVVTLTDNIDLTQNMLLSIIKRVNVIGADKQDIEYK
jgi:DNA invertase Pin-like site-specific DNA recombinase